MKILTIANNKGGVGKSTLTKLIGEGLAFLHGQRVLFIDADPQCNLSECFLPMRLSQGAASDPITPPAHPDYEPNHPDWPRDYLSLADLYAEQGTDWYRTEVGGISIIPAESGRMEPDALKVYADTMGEGSMLALLRHWLQEVVAKDNLFDVVLIDTPPHRGLLTRAAIHAANAILVPAKMDKFSLTGLTGMFSMLTREQSIRESGDELKILGILPTQFNKGMRQHQGFLKSLQNHATLSRYMSHLVMHHWSGYQESSMYGWEQSVFALQPKDKVRQEAKAIVDFVKEGLFHG